MTAPPKAHAAVDIHRSSTWRSHSEPSSRLGSAITRPPTTAPVAKPSAPCLSTEVRSGSRPRLICSCMTEASGTECRAPYFSPSVRITSVSACAAVMYPVARPVLGARIRTRIPGVRSAADCPRSAEAGSTVRIQSRAAIRDRVTVTYASRNTVG